VLEKAKLDINRIKRDTDAERPSATDEQHDEASPSALNEVSISRGTTKMHESLREQPSWFVFELGTKDASPFCMVGPLLQHLCQNPTIVRHLIWRTPNFLDSLLQSDRDFCNFVCTELKSQGKFVEADPRVFGRALQTVARAEPSAFVQLISKSMDENAFLLSQAIRTEPKILAGALLAGAQQVKKADGSVEGTVLADATELSGQCIRILGELLVEQPLILRTMFAHDGDADKGGSSDPSLRERLVQAFGQQLLQDAASKKAKPNATVAAADGPTTTERDNDHSGDTSHSVAVGTSISSPATTSLVCDLLRLEPRTLLRVLQSPVGVACGRAILRGDKRLLHDWVRSGCAELGSHFVLQVRLCYSCRYLLWRYGV
jgi:hypothetical protein